MPSPVRSLGEIESFVTLLCVACEDGSVYERLEKILSLPNNHRKVVLMALLQDMRMNRAPEDFVLAIESLLDDAVAEKAYEVIFKCQRGIF